MAKLREKIVSLEKDSRIVENEKKLIETIGNITHDLKTPLALIAGYSESLMDGMDDKPYAKLIHDRAIEMNDMVLNIIDASKTDREVLKNNKIRVLLKTYLKEKFDKALFVAEEKGIECIVGKIPGKYAYIATDDFDRVIENLVSNAVKHTEKGGKIKVTFRGALHSLTMCIKDTGSGIKKEDLPHVFDIYYTEDKARTKGGSGIGLSYVKKVIEENEGKVWIKSKEGEGTSVYITIECFNKNTIDRAVGDGDMRKCNKWTAFWLCFFCGLWGAHKLYEGKAGLSFIYSITGGLFVFGWLIDIIIYLLKPNPYYTKVY